MGDTNEQESVTLEVPMHHAAELEELLRQWPGLQHHSEGWTVKTFVIVGPPRTIAEFRPTLRQWQHDCASRDAW